MASRPTPAGDISTTHAIQPTVQLTCLVAMSSIIAEVMSRYVGVAFFGCTFVAFLSGITTAQFLVFRASEVVDHRVLRSLVSCLWVVDGVHSALVSWPAYAWAVSDRSNVLGVLYGNVWSFRGAALLTGISNLGVRSIYIHRIWKLSRNKYLTILLSILSCVNFALSLAVTFNALQVRNLIDVLLALYPEIYASLACLAASDMAVAISVCVLLAHRSSTTPRTTHVIHTLMLHSIESGLTTSIVSMTCLITYATLMPNNACFLAIFSILPKLALNSMLAMLNARTGLRRSHGSVILSPGSIPLQGLSQNSSAGHKDPAKINISIHQEVQHQIDPSSSGP